MILKIHKKEQNILRINMIQKQIKKMIRYKKDNKIIKKINEIFIIIINIE
jgi:hypothetical protein